MDGKFHLPWWGITILLAILGGGISLVNSGLGEAGYLAHWKKLGTLPERAVRIVAFDIKDWTARQADIAIQTDSGRIFQYQVGENSWVELIGFKPVSENIGLSYCADEQFLPTGAFKKLPASYSICGFKRWAWEIASSTSYYVVLEDNTVWTWYSQSGPTGVGFSGWDELTAICVGWLIIGGFRIIPEEYSRRTKLGFTLVILCIAAVVFWLFRVAAPLANGLAFAAVYSSGGIWGCICVGALVVTVVIVIKLGKDRYV